MRLRLSLFSKILLWFFLNLIVLGAVILVFFNLQFRFAPGSFLSATSGNRMEYVARMISEEMRAAAATDRAAILQRYSASYQVDFLLYSDRGEKLAGADAALPAEVLRRLIEGPAASGPPSPAEGTRRAVDERPPTGEGGRPFPRRPQDSPPPRPRAATRGSASAFRPQPIFTLKTADPTRYWAGVRTLLFEPDQFRPTRATLLAVSTSMTGHGLFFDVKPWLLIIAIVLTLSILLWLPFVRSLTGRIKQMTAATELIAEEQFDTRVDERGTDELGRLSIAINQLAARLASFVGGQKRFLGDISHELNSPLARMHFALSILAERVNSEHGSYVADAQEEVRLMSEMVNELLAFAKAGMKTAENKLVSVPLAPLVQRICAREASASDIRIDIADDAAVLAQPELLSRALANVLRNATRYAAESEISIAAVKQNDHIRLTITDHGPGVPPESLIRLFDPFYRLGSDRARATGGSGLGLSIVKTCVEACQGTVAARNASPSGLEISMMLRAGTPQSV